jgi:hypothetical protein
LNGLATFIWADTTVYLGNKEVSFCPTMGPELALAIDACVTESASLLVIIFKNANEVRHHKEKCLALGEEARRLRDLLEANKTHIRTLETVKQFTVLVHDIDCFVALSKTWTIVGAALDTWFAHDFRKLMNRCEKIKKALVLEAAVSVAFITLPQLRTILLLPALVSSCS